MHNNIRHIDSSRKLKGSHWKIEETKPHTSKLACYNVFMAHEASLEYVYKTCVST